MDARRKRIESHVLKGWLDEKSKMPLFGGWSKRYFVLEGDKLRCYRDQQSTKPVWEMNVTNAEIRNEKAQLHFCVEKSIKSIKLRAKSLDDLNSWVQSLERRGKQSIKNFYRLDDEIGGGAHSTVRMGVDRFTGKNIAVKTIRVGQNSALRLMADREISVYRCIRHKSLINALDVFKRNNEVNIVMEYASGGTLADLLDSFEDPFLTENEARQIMRSVIEGLAYLHGRNIVHRDIKPANILLMNPEAPYEAKISDFGLARSVNNTPLDIALAQHRREGVECEKTHCGSPAYVAPDVFNGSDYGTEVDIWSAGALLYRMLSGEDIYSASDLSEAAGILSSFKVSFNARIWDYISLEARDLLTKMLNVDGASRITAEEVMDHHWMKSDLQANVL